MDRELVGFARFFVVIVAVFLAVGAILAVLLRQTLLATLVQVYFWLGIAYVGASTLAWSGIANLYRYSPTLFIGSRSYRQQIVRSQMWKEGREDRDFVLGLSFGAALLGLAAALYDPLFALPDILIIAAILAVLRLRRARPLAQM
jgi:hypothetical protein